MESSAAVATPGGHTPSGGVLVGSEGARRRLVLFEDPQCPYCRQFEEASGDMLRREVAVGAVAIEYRMRCFLGIESVRADNALALAAESGRFDELRRELFAAQPPEQSGGFTVADLVEIGRRAGLREPNYERGVRDSRYERWVIEIDRKFQEQDPRAPRPHGWMGSRSNRRCCSTRRGWGRSFAAEAVGDLHISSSRWTWSTDTRWSRPGWRSLVFQCAGSTEEDPLMMDVPLTTWLLFSPAGRHHHQTEVVSRSSHGEVHRYTFGDFSRRAQQLMHGLDALGIQPGQRVATLSYNGYRHLEAYFGVPCSGRVLHTLNLRLSAAELAFIMNDADDAAVLVESEFLPLLDSVLPQVPGLRHVIVLDGPAPSREGSAAAWVAYEELIGSQSGEFARPALDERDPAGLCYTSGTTGKPKGVLYTHRSTFLHALAVTSAAGMSVGPGDCVLPQVPMFHAGAWGLPHAAVAVGAKLVFYAGAFDAPRSPICCSVSGSPSPPAYPRCGSDWPTNWFVDRSGCRTSATSSPAGASLRVR